MYPEIPKPGIKQKISAIFRYIPKPNEEIENVAQAARYYFTKRHKKALVIYICFFACWIVFFGYILLSKYSSNSLATSSEREAPIYILFFPLLPIILIYALVYSQVLRAFMEQFAKNNNYSFLATGWLNGLSSALLNIGHGKKMKNIISGNFESHSLNLFNYSYTTGSGKSQQTHSCTVFKVSHDHLLPPILLTVDSQIFGGINPAFGNAVKVKPEGNFDKNFDIFTQEKNEIEALQIFTPNVMEKMLGDFKQFNLEFSGRDIFIYINKFVTTKKELLKMYELTKYLIERLDPVLKRMESTVKAMAEQRQ